MCLFKILLFFICLVTNNTVFNQKKIENNQALFLIKIKSFTSKEKIVKYENKLKITEHNGIVLITFLLAFLCVFVIYLNTKQSKMYKVIAIQKEELNQLNKTKDKLFMIVSHDLRSSISLLKKSNYDLLIAIKNENYQKLNTIVHKNIMVANSSYNLLENLLNWATLQTQQLYFQIESVDLFSIMQQVVFNYQPLFDAKKITFKNTISPATFILADVDTLKIIIRNLLDNAIKFSNINDKISVSNFTSKNMYESLVIEDTGIGMHKKTVDEILKNSCLLHKKKNKETIGTGLGLHLCKKMILKNKAKLKIESEINKGTKMIISFLIPN